MLLSIVGSATGFVISTNTTRNSIIDSQLQEDQTRLKSVFSLAVSEAADGAEALSTDPHLIDLLLRERFREHSNFALDMSARAVNVRERFGLDQVMVLNAEGQTRTNVATGRLEALSIEGDELISLCRNTELSLFEFTHGGEPLPLLVLCYPIYAESTSGEQGIFLGDVYAILDLQALMARIERDLELNTELDLAAQPFVDAERAQAIAAAPSRSDEGFRSLPIALPVQADLDRYVQLVLKVEEQTINDIVNSGLRVTVLSSGLTLLLVLAVGAWLAQSFTRPILKLSRVAQGVAAGDLTVRANLTHQDEIGQLGRAVDRANETIAHLLVQQAQTAAERQATLQSIADGVLAVDTHERIILMNPAAASLLQQAGDSLIGQPLSAMRTSDDPTLTVGLQQIIEQIQSELIDPDMAPTEERVSLGSQVVRINSTPVLGSYGERTGAVVVIQDITSAVEADRMKSEFIATASHEMRTPLTSLKGFVDVFSMTGVDNLNDSQRMFLDTIKRQTDSIIQLVNDLLEMARLEQGTQRPERRWVQPTVVIDESITNLKGMIAQRNVTIELDMPPEMPPIWIDQMHLRRILTNLISNGVKYVYQGGTVRVRAYELTDPEHLPSLPLSGPWSHRDERSLIVAIEDDGVGIRQEDQDKIFNRFFRSENPLSIEVGGTGLGLAITKSLVEMHACQIGFWSRENEGSCFWVRMPLPRFDALESDGSSTTDEQDLSPLLA